MPEGITHIIELAVIVLNLSSALVIVGGLLAAFGAYLYQIRQQSLEEGYQQFKPRLARVLMLALEILVVADVIETVTLDISLKSLAALGLLVVVRTWLSWTLDLDAEGHWPWQHAKEV